MEEYFEQYIKKRNFAKTPEPPPVIDPASDDTLFVVHRHDARNLHFDLRIAYGGRLVCFAVPKGFTYDPSVKRLAVHTEDHPIGYIGFEGIIPKGEYGAGAMTIWDAGTYSVEKAGNLDESLARGEIKLRLFGRRLRGEWHLVKLKTDKDEWLVFKANDAYAKKGWDALFTSVDLSEQPEAAMLDSVTRMTYGSTSEPFTDPAWGFEILFEGRRLFCRKDKDRIRFMDSGRAAADDDYLYDQLPQLWHAIPERAIFDGILVAVDSDGIPSRAILDKVLLDKPPDSSLLYYMLDILYFEDYDVRSLPYSARKELLSRVMSDNAKVLYVDYLKTEGEIFAAEAKKTGVSSVIAKKLTSVYEEGESENWRLVPLAGYRAAGDTALGKIVPKRISIRISNPDKVFFPEANITKQELVDYYADVTDYILPYVTERIVHINRFPDGIHGESFYQKHLSHDPPDFLALVNADGNPESDGKPYFVCNNKASLLYLVNLGTIDIHAWFSSVRDLAHPDWIAWDLDPKGADFADVIRLAKDIGKILRGIGFIPFLKTSGKTGLHILVPIEPVYTYDQTRMFAESVARIVVSENRGIATVERNVERREKRVYIDYLQNRRGQTLVPPYTVRPVAEASVSMPLEWEELDKSLSVQSFNIRTARKRIADKGDLFGRLFSSRKDLVAAIGKLEALVNAEKK